jgi:hypothetical protein
MDLRRSVQKMHERMDTQEKMIMGLMELKPIHGHSTLNWDEEDPHDDGESDDEGEGDNNDDGDGTEETKQSKKTPESVEGAERI